jgi:hypothetical protein
VDDAFSDEDEGSAVDGEGSAVDDEGAAVDDVPSAPHLTLSPKKTGPPLWAMTRRFP